jgi:hypothetical protein
MRRRRVIVGLAVLALVGAFAVGFWPHGPRPCRATFALVHEGMTYEEVCATVGGPPGDYTGGTRSGPDDLIGMVPCWLDGDDNRSRSGTWIGEDGELFAIFDPDDRLAWVEVWEVHPVSPPPFWTRLLARLGL